MFNTGAIGCGYWGPNLVRNLMMLPDTRVKRVCDLRKERLDHMRSLYPGIETTTDYKEVIGDPEIDAVAIATPVRYHFGMAKECLLAGKHVFVEKPMTASVAESEELVALADEKKLTLMVGHTFIYTPVVRKIKEIIRRGEIGQVLYISTRRLNLGLFQTDINVAWDLAAHDISIILYLIDENPSSVNCQGKAHITEGIEDVTNMSLNFRNGGFAVIQSSWLDPNKTREMIIVGSKRMIVYDDVEPMEKIRIYDKRVEAPPHYDTFAEFHYSYHYGDMYSPYVKQQEPLRLECQHFVDCMRTGAKPDSSGEAGLQVVRVLEAASESLRNHGGMVEISMSEPHSIRKVS